LRVSVAPSLDVDTSREITFLFVYGGLMRGFDLHHHLAGCSFAGDASTHGVLVQAGRYPGLIQGQGKVSGELYVMSDPPASLEALDELEDYDPLDPQRSLYIRSVRPVSKQDGSVARAWVYLYNRDTTGLVVVTSGDWRSVTGIRPVRPDP
jgi:gamma-glutamylcyclotransferase (GGCT)/AIG2-like uncharacterized protein YtfP